ncbi:HIT-like domain-containing protein [Coniella lustricola]|uniref:Aprataxin-like protein n=1 Tax=Coniella lustricola TaxID=2025994 RepID=A0A2T3A1K7_9PEZI|nr:HIT-like domain-containing protein [Coniella lustricola]
MASNHSTAGLKRPSASLDPDVESTQKHARKSEIDSSELPAVTEEALTEEEIQGTELPLDQAAEEHGPRNAFSALMGPKPKPQPKPPSTAKTTFAARNGLGAYLTDPGSFPASRVIFHSPTAVAIHDMFPKATVHCLLLPRSPAHNLLHPFEALADPPFLAQVRAEAAKLKDLAAKELQRILGKHSAAEAGRNAVLNGEAEPSTDANGTVVLPQGRDWMREIKVGVHAVPSMNHLHVHVFSRDMHSEKMKKRKHYNSFTTDFMVPLDDFPLAIDDPRRHQGKWPERPMLCWRCGKNFGNQFQKLTEHLEVEFQAWKRE